MAIELDHFFVLTEPGAPQAVLLSEIGLVEGTTNNHPGQGTANRRFFFSNTALELLYIRDAEEAANGPARELRIVERAADAGASPFGLVVSRTTQSNDDPFSGWRYYPVYFDDDQYFHVGDNSDILDEPLCICMPTMAPARAKQSLQPEIFSEVTEVRISLPPEKISPELKTIAQCELIAVIPGQPHFMEIVFNDEGEGRSKDLRPALPLVIRW